MKSTDLCEQKFCQKALKILDENLSNSLGVNIVEPVQHPGYYGDVISWKLPRKEFIASPLENSLECCFTVPDSEWSEKLSKFTEWYIQPAMNDLAIEIKKSNKGSVKFSNMDNLHESTGVRSFVGSYKNLKLRCDLQYKSEENGTKVTFKMLFASEDITDRDRIIGPREPAITITREGQ